MLGNMNVKKLLLKFTIPASLAMFFDALYNLVDTIFVAWGSGEIAIGALGIVFPIWMIVFAFALMIGIGSASVFSRAYGRGDADAMRKTVHTALLFNIVLASVFTLIGLVFIDEILVIFGATASNISDARDYMFFIVIALVPFSSAIVLNNLTRAEGRPKIAMTAMIIGAVVNIILDPILIFNWGFGLGVKGAAIATLIAKSMMFIYILSASFSKKSSLGLRFNLGDINGRIFRQILVIGLPTFIRNSLGAFMFVLVNRLINVYAPGDPAIYISVMGVMNRMIIFLLLPGFGLVQGLIPIVGFNFGAKKHERLHDVITYGTRLLITYFWIIFLIMLLGARLIYTMFSREADPVFIETGTQAFRIVAFGFTLLGFQFIMSSVYQAMGFAVRAFLIALSRQFLLFIPLVLILTSLFGIIGIWFSFLAADALSGLISYGAYRHEMRHLKVQMRLSSPVLPVT